MEAGVVHIMDVQLINPLHKTTGSRVFINARLDSSLWLLIFSSMAFLLWVSAQLHPGSWGYRTHDFP